MPAISAGILLYRWAGGEAGEASPAVPAGRVLEVLLVHPGGPYYAKKDAGVWGIPKGEARPEELSGAASAAGPPAEPAGGAEAPAGEPAGPPAEPPPAPAEPWRRPPKVKPRLEAAVADLLAVAKREFREETGMDADALAAPGADYRPLGGIKQRGHKIVYAWALEGDADAGAMVSDTFEIEWPPRSGRAAAFPEVDRAAWFPLAAAREAITAGQRRFLDDLQVIAGGGAN